MHENLLHCLVARVYRSLLDCNPLSSCMLVWKPLGLYRVESLGILPKYHESSNGNPNSDGQVTWKPRLLYTGCMMLGIVCKCTRSATLKGLASHLVIIVCVCVCVCVWGGTGTKTQSRPSRDSERSSDVIIPNNPKMVPGRILLLRTKGRSSSSSMFSEARPFALSGDFPGMGGKGGGPMLPVGEGMGPLKPCL